MYCPNCGSFNQAEINFCTRCGTNLTVVSGALTGKLDAAAYAERAEKLIKKYSSGRRETVTGAGLIVGGMMIMMILIFAGMPAMGAFWVLCWMFFWGVISLATGLGKWVASSDEMKQLGLMEYGGRLPNRVPERSLPARQEDNTQHGVYGPAGYPGSVTEQTTRKLRERANQASESGPGRAG